MGLLLPFILFIVPTTIAESKPLVPVAVQSEVGMGQELLIPSTISINSGMVTSGEVFTASIDLDVPPSNSLTAVTIDIEYDPTVLGSSGACFANTANFTLNLCNRSDGDGQPPDVFSYTAINVTGVNGVINLGAIPFTAVNPGTSALNIVVRTFEDGSGELPSVVNGSVQVQEPTATAVHLQSFSVPEFTTKMQAYSWF